MRCLPFSSCKKVYKYWGESDTHYQWNNKLSMWPQSFNDQPGSRYANILFWHNNGDIHRAYNKPSHYESSNENSVFYTEGRIIPPPLNIHKDYQTSRTQ